MATHYYDKQFLGSVKLLSYAWTYIDLTLPIGLPEKFEGQNKPQNYKNKWFKCPCPYWKDRTAFTDNDPSKTTTWSDWLNSWFQKSLDTLMGTQKKWTSAAPFQPPLLRAEKFQQAGFFYHFYFKFTGHSFATVQAGTSKEIEAPEKCDQCPSTCKICLRPENISDSGEISPRTFRRITEPDNSCEVGDSETTEEEETEEENEYSYLYRFIREKLKKAT